jgi:hypothetical protein
MVDVKGRRLTELSSGFMRSETKDKTPAFSLAVPIGRRLLIELSTSVACASSSRS